jgi:hypothetical protein
MLGRKCIPLDFQLCEVMLLRPQIQERHGHWMEILAGWIVAI